jgi:tetratricopeptide (TPR) repeat protein
MRYKGTNKGTGEIATELKAGSILEGSVRKAVDDLRITAQLIDTKSDECLWSQDYDKKLANVFVIQREIAHSVAEALKVRLLSSERRDIDRGTTKDTDAYSMYLKGRYYWNERTRDGNERAIKYFEQAVRLDAVYAPAYSGLADCYVIAGDYGWEKPDQAYPKAREFALKAIEIDSRLAEPHATLGLVYTNHEWRWQEAEKEFKTAIELKPSYATAHQWYGVHFCIQFEDRLEEASNHIRQASELDPLSRVIALDLGVASIVNGRISEAIVQLERVIYANPDYAAPHDFLGFSYYLNSKVEQGIKELRKAVALSGGEPAYKSDLAFLLGSVGLKDEAESILSALRELSSDFYVSTVEIAKPLFGLGRADEAFGYLEQAFLERSYDILDFNAMPWFSTIRKDPRWLSLSKRIGL